MNLLGAHKYQNFNFGFALLFIYFFLIIWRGGENNKVLSVYKVSKDVEFRGSRLGLYRFVLQLGGICIFQWKPAIWELSHRLPLPPPTPRPPLSRHSIDTYTSRINNHPSPPPSPHSVFIRDITGTSWFKHRFIIIEFGVSLLIYLSISCYLSKL
jgi:hypothetical protein